MFKKNPELRENTFQLYPFIESVLKHDISNDLKACLVEIKNTESVLYAYANLFRHLQSRPVWQLARNKPTGDISITFPKKQDYVFGKDAVLILNDTLVSLAEEKSKIALAAVKRNETVSEKKK